MSEPDDRKRGILSPEDREFLRGEREHISQGAKYNTRRRIRQRVKNGILDFVLLFRELPETDRVKIVDEFDMGPVEASSGGITVHIGTSGPPAITRALAFLCLLHEDTDQFELSLRTALSAVSRQRSDTHYQKVSVDIDLREWSREDIQALRKKLDQENLQDLTRAEQDFLIDQLGIDVLAAALEGFEERETDAPGEEGS